MKIREARDADLPSILALYGQPDFDNGVVADLEAARGFLDTIGRLFPPDHA